MQSCGCAFTIYWMWVHSTEFDSNERLTSLQRWHSRVTSVALMPSKRAFSTHTHTHTQLMAHNYNCLLQVLCFMLVVRVMNEIKLGFDWMCMWTQLSGRRHQRTIGSEALEYLKRLSRVPTLEGRPHNRVLKFEFEFEYATNTHTQHRQYMCGVQ